MSSSGAQDANNTASTANAAGADDAGAPVVDETEAVAVAPSWERRRRAIAAMVVTSVLVAGQLYAVIPVLAELARDWKVPPTAPASLITSFGLVCAVAFVLGGSAARRLGTRPVITLALAALAFGGAALAAATSLAAGEAFRIVQGAGAGFFFAAVLTHLRDRVDPGQWPGTARRAVLTLVGAAVAGPALAEVVAGLVGWRGVFGVGAVAVVWSGAWLHLVLGRAVHGPRGVLRTTLRQTGTLLVRPRTALLCLAALPVFGGMAAVGVALEALGPTALTADTDTMFAVRASAAIPVVVVAAADHFLRRLRALRLAALALAVTAAATAGLWAGGGSAGALAALLATAALGVAVAAPALVDALDAAAGTARDSVLSLSFVAFVLGAGFFPRLVAPLAGSGLSAVVVVVAVLELVAAGLVIAVDQRRRAPADRTSAD